MSNATLKGDELLALLHELPADDMIPARAVRVRELAHAVLARRRCSRVEPGLGLLASIVRLLEPALAGALGLGFLAWVVTRSLEILGARPL